MITTSDINTILGIKENFQLHGALKDILFDEDKNGSLTVVSIFSLTKSLKTLIISMLLSFFVVKFVKFNVGICRNVWYNSCRR